MKKKITLVTILVLVSVLLCGTVIFGLEGKPIEVLDAEIKAEGLHLKFDDQLVAQAESISEKIPRVQHDLNSFILFPDARREEIYDLLVEAGEIESALDGATSLSASALSKVESEYQDGLKFYQDKVDRLKMLVGLIAEEQELRASEEVTRNPIGTTYYVDFDNGNDAHDGTHTAETDSNADGPWATLNKVGSTLNDPDKAVVRRGMVQAVSADLVFTNDGTRATPIVVEADYDDAWGDEATATETATLTFGSKTVTFAGDISGDISVGDWIYETNEDNREFAYEVAAISGGSNEIVTLFIPYKGAQAGAGKTINIMPDNPIWNTAAGNYQLTLVTDNHWKFQGLHIRGTDPAGTVLIDSCAAHEFSDCIFEGNDASDGAIMSSDDAGICILRKCRFLKYAWGLRDSAGAGGKEWHIYDCLFDGDGQASSRGWLCGTWNLAYFFDCEFKNHVLGDIASAGDVMHSGKAFFRNCLFSSATEIDNHHFSLQAFYSEDHDQAVGDNRQLTGLSVAEGTPSIQSETSKVRGGGGTTSIKCTPSANLSTLWKVSKVKLFEYPVYLVKDVEKTFTVYLSSDDDTDWDADPLNTELWIEAEYWGHATNVARQIKKSTEVCNNFDADDTVWDTLTVTITPLEDGIVYLRGFYCKTKEGGKSNIFYCDVKIDIS